MANDGSLASLSEEWIAARLRTISVLADDAVEVFKGSTAPDGAALIKEFLAKRSPFAIVLFEGDTARALEEGAQAYDPIYAVYVIVRNARDGMSRTGDGTTVGTNWLRDKMRVALHDKSPGFGANGFWAERSEFRGVRIVFQQKGAFIMRAEIVIREDPQSA